MATAPSPNDLTRQQLDELDALLQKMLTPLATGTPPPVASLPPMAQPPLPPSWRIDPPQVPDGFGGLPRSAPPPPRAVSFAEISLGDPPASLKFEPPGPAPVSSVPKAVKPAPAPTSAPAPTPAPPPVQSPKPVAKVTPAPLPTPAPQPKAMPTPPASVAVTPAPPMPPVPLLFLPLVALEGLFDNVCAVFGPLGRLFRSGFFKYLYGFAGLGLVAYTALRVAQVQGWLTLPFVLPWPK